MKNSFIDYLRRYIRDELSGNRKHQNSYSRNTVMFDSCVCNNISVPSKYDRSFDYYNWRKAYEMCNSNNLNILIDKTEDEKVKNALRAYLFYYDSNFYVDDIFEIQNFNGMSAENSIREGVRETFEVLDPVYAALLSGWISRIEIKDLNCSGRYVRKNRKIIIDTYEKETVYHEIGHALQDIMGVFGIWVYDNREAPEWLRLNMLEKNLMIKTNKIQKDFKKRFSQIWDNYGVETDKHIRSYQNKNINEFLTVGFEQWISNRHRLMEIQPELCELFEDYFGGLKEGESYFRTH